MHHEQQQQPANEKPRIYYIIEKQPGKYEIIKVNPADETNFLADYGQYVITKAESLMEALLSFEQVKMR